MLLKSYFELMADYNQGMNRRIYIAASKLSPSTLLYQQGIDVGVTDLLVNIPSVE
jgi:uncharacterized damage-inducible protein DinB